MKVQSRMAALLVLAGLVVPLAASHAQPAGDQAVQPGQETILVVAPRNVQPKGKRASYTGAALVTTSVSVPVLYGDLDLKSDRDVDRLMARVDHVSRDACRQLDRLVRFSRDPECFAKAHANGEAAARVVIDAARAR